MKPNGDIVEFLKKRDYVMVNNALGSGSFGKTVLLQDPFIDELVVAKKYEPETDDSDVKERFYRNFLDEIKMLYKLNHRNVVRIYNYYAYEEVSTGYILMEYIEGKTIDKFVAEYWDDFLPIAHMDDVFTQLVDGFQYIERNGIVHRDIREGNIMVDKSGVAKIIDFGIGKVIEKGVAPTDSLVAEINRADSETLPQEHYEGIYTSKTDMFYLAELLNRLIKGNKRISDTDFTYHNILDKMMDKNPRNRYPSFKKVREAIDKYDFINMDISEADKKIYQEFSNFLFRAISCYIDERKFNYDVDAFIAQLENALRANCFEDTVQNNADIIRSIVTGNFRYNSITFCSASYNGVREFLDWFKKSTPQSQQLILNNLIFKVSRIDIEISEADLPF